jgi:YHS domain-containing protein
MLDAMRHVILQHLFLNAAKRGAHRRDLRDDVDAIAVLVDHLREAADLALDPAQAFLTGSLDVFSHAAYIPLQGMGFKVRRRRLMGTIEHASISEANARCADHGGHGHHHHHGDPEDIERDPICGMTIDPATSKHTFGHKGKTFHFCSSGCRTKFSADPTKYLDKQRHEAEAAHADVPQGAIHTCPMHPKIRQVGPGNCPICGMALEPEVASLKTAPNPELADMT